MALPVPYSDPKIRKQFILKDYLLDDLSSCSSSGFRSFPRRKCFPTSVRFLLEIELTKKNKSHHPLLTGRRSKSAASSPAKSTLKKASEAVINAVKHLPFAAAAAVRPRKAILPRSFSKKLFKRSFWKKSDRKEIERWKSFPAVVEQKSNPSDFYLSKTTTVTAAVTDSISSTKCSSSESNGKSKKSYGSSWSDSDYTRSSSCSSGNSETVNSCDKVLPNEEVGKRVAVIVGEDSTAATTTPTASCIIDSPKKQWPNEEAKEQCSPVSVLDCPFDKDDGEAEEEVSLPFKRRLTRVEGTKHRLMQELGRFESRTQLEPVDLEKRIEFSDFDRESVGSPPIQENNISDEEEEDNKTETKAVELLEQMKAKTPSVSFKFKAENLFLDFFREGIMEENACDCELLDVAKDWINGQPQELFLGWEVQKNRQAYIKDMEKGGMWGKLDEDKEEVALELEAEIFTSFVNDLFFDLFNLAI